MAAHAGWIFGLGVPLANSLEGLRETFKWLSLPHALDQRENDPLAF